MEEDYYNTKEASKLLGISESRVRQMLASGELEGHHDVNKTWRIPQRAVHERREERGTREPRGLEAPSSGPDVNALIDRIASLEHELGRAEATAELTEQAHSTVQEQLERERERADRLEAELTKERGKGFLARLFGG